MKRRDPRTTNGHRRREIRARVLATYDHCALCGHPVDKTLGMLPGQHGPRCKNSECEGCVPHPMRPEVDEILPVSRGGNPLKWDNVQLAHRICNQRKGNHPHNARLARLAATNTTITTSQQW